jgi:hypothetical protein
MAGPDLIGERLTSAEARGDSRLEPGAQRKIIHVDMDAF